FSKLLTMGIQWSGPQSCGDSRVVKTKFGSVLGRRFSFDKREVDAFQGIPFASPPVGQLRFQKPVWPQPWDGVKETKGFAARGIQKDPFFFEKMKMGKMSEDNLYLNVFTPVWNPEGGSGFPVMVFIHGGGFVSDSSIKYGDVGICQHLCTKDVVVVTIQYRLGLLGFFSTGDEHCPGNFALWDQTLALRWIQENIAFFNGDPNNVTVMGQSAGGASVDLLSICPHSRDLFHKVIPMAGNASCSWAIHNDMVEECRKFAERNGIHETRDSKKMIDALRALPSSKFALSLMDNMGKPSVASSCAVGPRLDFDFIPKDHSVGAIMEYIAQLVPEKEYPREFKKFREELFEKLVSNPAITLEVMRALSEALGDLFVNVGVQTTILETLEAHDAPVYFYSFDYFNPKSWGPLAMRWPFKDATHCTELAYIFAVGIIWHYDFNHDDKKMLELTTRMWTNFAKYG
ncbi:Carboxylesterase, partial [Teladorsagia circumcincta]